jgi:hypothetical protein
MINYDKLQKSLKHLEAQYANYQTIGDRAELGELEKEAIAESVIQRFETCYDTLWKALKRYLNEELGLPELPNSPWPLFQIAAENHLYTNDVMQWKKYVDARIGTSHDYSDSKAEEALILMGDFISDAIDLYITMTGSTWE